jgi:hypothetical protein
MAHREMVVRLLKLAAEMVCRKGMPYDCDDDWQFPASVSRKQRSRIYEQIDAAHEQCRQWGIAVRDCAHALNSAPCAAVDSQAPTNTGSPKLPGVKKYLEWADKREIRKTGHRLTQSDLDLLEAGYKFIARQLRADA